MIQTASLNNHTKERNNNNNNSIEFNSFINVQT
jgi:hypothetical protein